MSNQSFRGLKWAPSYEGEVAILFGMLLPYMEEKIVIDEYTDVFPDCKANIDGKDVEIEFEVKSSNFVAQRHDCSKCHIIVCWENDLRNCPIEVIALKDRAEKVKKERGIVLIQNPMEKEPPRQWDERTFFEYLNRRVGERVRSLIEELYKFCKNVKKYPIRFGSGKFATFGVLSEGGKRGRVFLLVDSKGMLTIDFQTVPEDIASICRENVKAVREDASWRAWVYLEANESTVNLVKELLEVAIESKKWHLEA